MLSIDIRYQLTGASDWLEVQLEPSTYFGPDAKDSDGNWDIQGTPRHGHVTELFPLAGGQQLRNAMTRVKDTITGDYFQCAYHFWNGNRDHVCLVTHQNGPVVEREVIFTGNVPSLDNGSQVIRITLDDSIPQLTSNAFMWGSGGDEHYLDMLSYGTTGKA
jgi:hypothetical protein